MDLKDTKVVHSPGLEGWLHEGEGERERQIRGDWLLYWLMTPVQGHFAGSLGASSCEEKQA